MQDHNAGWTFFETALGTCALAWGPRGIVAVQLPEADAHTTQARLLRASGPLLQTAPPPAVADAVATITDALAGRAHDMATVRLDSECLTDFQRRVYAVACRIPPGQTRTYGEIAAELGDKGLARAVGRVLGANPFAPVVPCHRVLAAGGKSGGFSAHGGAATKLRMLATEGTLQGDTQALFRAD